MARKAKWVNPNPTACNHAGCQIAARSKADKAAHQKAPMKVIYVTSSLTKRRNNAL